MRFRIVQTHQRGKLLSRQEIASADGVIGDLTTALLPDPFLRETVIVATLRDPDSGTQCNELLPPLYLATLRLIARQGLMLSGHERIVRTDSSVVEFAQGWWARQV